MCLKVFSIHITKKGKKFSEKGEKVNKKLKNRVKSFII